MTIIIHPSIHPSILSNRLTWRMITQHNGQEFDHSTEYTTSGSFIQKSHSSRFHICWDTAIGHQSVIHSSIHSSVSDVVRSSWAWLVRTMGYLLLHFGAHKTKKECQRKPERARALVEWVHLAWVHLGTVRYHQSVAAPHRVLQVVGLPACIAFPSLFFLSCSSCFLSGSLASSCGDPGPFSGLVASSGPSSSSSSSWPLFRCLLLSRAAQVCKYFVAELLIPFTNCVAHLCCCLLSGSGVGDWSCFVLFLLLLLLLLLLLSPPSPYAGEKNTCRHHIVIGSACIACMYVGM